MKLFDNIHSQATDTAYILIFLGLLLIPNAVLSVTETMTILAAAVNIAVPLAVYYLILCMSGNLGQTIWLMFPFIFLAAFQLVLLWLYGRSIIAVDMFLNLVTTNPGEAGELLGNMWPSVLMVIALYVPPLVAATMMTRKRYRLTPAAIKSNRRASHICCAVACALIAAVVAYDKQWNPLHDLYPLNVIYNGGLAVERTLKTNRHEDLSRGFTFDARTVGPSDSLPDVIMLVIGETSRADHWQINGYNRPTNPRLPHSPGCLWSFPHAISESNTTHKSVPLMMTHLTPLNFGDSIYAVKSLITAFSEAGYATRFISNQRHNRSFIDFFAYEADKTVFVKEKDGLNRPDASDLELLPLIDDALADDGNRHKLIVVHTYGSHFSYRDRYNADFRHFTPDDYTEIEPAQKTNLINAYDNTIVMTDSLLSAIAAKLDSSKAAIVYTSDHGEDILDDSRGLFLHASPCPTVHQIHVPMVVWLSDSYASARPALVMALDSNTGKRVSSNTSYFATALHLGGITTPRSDVTLTSLASERYTPPPMLYLNDHNRPVPTHESGLTPDDLQILKKVAPR